MSIFVGATSYDPVGGGQLAMVNGNAVHEVVDLSLVQHLMVTSGALSMQRTCPEHVEQARSLSLLVFRTDRVHVSMVLLLLKFDGDTTARISSARP